MFVKTDLFKNFRGTKLFLNTIPSMLLRRDLTKDTYIIYSEAHNPEYRVVIKAC